MLGKRDTVHEDVLPKYILELYMPLNIFSNSPLPSPFFPSYTYKHQTAKVKNIGTLTFLIFIIQMHLKIIQKEDVFLCVLTV